MKRTIHKRSNESICSLLGLNCVVICLQTIAEAKLFDSTEDGGSGSGYCNCRVEAKPKFSNEDRMVVCSDDFNYKD